MKLSKIAQQDASKWARAEMFFGEGAGTRRKLIWAEISDKILKVPGYEDAFRKAYESQDFAEHAIRAAKERKRIDRGNFLGKNARAIARGDRRNVSPVLLLAIGGAIVLHQTGYDKVLWEEAKKAKGNLEDRIAQLRVERRRLQSVGKHEDDAN